MKQARTLRRRLKTRTVSTGYFYVERVLFAADMLAGGETKPSIIKTLVHKFKISKYTALRVMSRAILQLRNLASQDYDFLKGKSLLFYEQVLRSPTAKLSEKLKARERLDDLLGLNMPLRVEIEDKNKELRRVIDLAQLVEGDPKAQELIVELNSRINPLLVKARHSQIDNGDISGEVCEDIDEGEIPDTEAPSIPRREIAAPCERLYQGVGCVDAAEAREK